MMSRFATTGAPRARGGVQHHPAEGAERCAAVTRNVQQQLNATLFGVGRQAGAQAAKGE